MAFITVEDVEEVAKIADALSHPLRVVILDILYENPNHIMSVRYLLKILEAEGHKITYAAFLPHQKKLVEAGLCSVIKGENLNMIVLNKYPAIVIEDLTRRWGRRNSKKFMEKIKKIEKWEVEHWDELIEELEVYED